jgi:hypothetical protein
MAAVNVLTLDALALQSRRPAWAHPEVKSHAAVVLAPQRLHAAPPDGAPAPEALAAVADGADAGGLLGPSATVIELASIRRVKLDLLSNSLVVEYASGADAGTLTVVFATPESADACFTRLWRRLGDGLRLVPYRRDPWSLARAPLALLAVILLATAALALGLSVFEDLASARAAARGAAPGPSALEAWLGWMDWRGVCAVGGVAAAVAQVWMYRRVTSPPLSLELVRE